MTLEEAQQQVEALRSEIVAVTQQYNKTAAKYNSATFAQQIELWPDMRRLQKKLKSLKMRERHVAKLATPEGMAHQQQQEQERQATKARRSATLSAIRAKQGEKWSEPCTLQPGSIVQVSGGYDACFHTFYEVVRATSAYVFMRELEQVRTQDMSVQYLRGTSTPVLGKYASGVSRFRASGTRIKLSRYYSSTLWDGKPQSWQDLS